MVSTPHDYLRTVSLGYRCLYLEGDKGNAHSTDSSGREPPIARGQLEGQPEISSSIDLFQQCQNSSLKKKIVVEHLTHHSEDCLLITDGKNNFHSEEV